ncbi:hypothetical protein BpHYR1_051228, partial [Brachionus plicatilis]
MAEIAKYYPADSSKSLIKFDEVEEIDEDDNRIDVKDDDDDESKDGTWTDEVVNLSETILDHESKPTKPNSLESKMNLKVSEMVSRLNDIKLTDVKKSAIELEKECFIYPKPSSDATEAVHKVLRSTPEQSKVLCTICQEKGIIKHVQNERGLIIH